MRQLNASEMLINRVLNQLEQFRTQFDVWPENHTAVSIFLLLQTQWDRNPMDNSMLGLKWPSVETAIRRYSQSRHLPPEQQDQLFWDITHMERHALSELNNVKAEQQQ